MQLLLSVSLTFLIVIPALCWPSRETVHDQQIPPRETVHDQHIPPRETVHDQQIPPRETVHDQQIPPRETIQNQQAYRQNAPTQRGNTAAVTKQFYEYAQAAQESEEPDENFSEELIDLISRNLEENGGRQKADTESASTWNYLRQGCTVGLQLAENYLWLGCSGSYCAGATCPGKFFDGDDVSYCWGEVFQMYHLEGGGGAILSGDYVGLYYPAESTWFSMYYGYGHKNSCPGTPTYDYGFSYSYQWQYCGGEVFRVFAEGRNDGDYIYDQDTIAFYYVYGGYFVGFQPYWPTPSGCMYYCPPYYYEFDWCYYDSVELTIYD